MRVNERKALVCLRERLYGMGAAASTAVCQPCLFNGNMPPSQQTRYRYIRRKQSQTLIGLKTLDGLVSLGRDAFMGDTLCPQSEALDVLGDGKPCNPDQFWNQAQI